MSISSPYFSFKKLVKGKFYLVWRETYNPLSGSPTGDIPANKRSLTSDHFTESVRIPKNTRVLFVQKARHGQVRVLYNDTLVQLHERFLVDDPKSQA